MGKKNKSTQFPKGSKPGASSGQAGSQNSQPVSASDNTISVPLNSSGGQLMVKPEQMSLTAYAQIQNYMQNAGKTSMEKEDLNAVLRLSQHLRLFGFLSAAGYVNQSNAQEGAVRDRTVPVWGSLLGQMLGLNPDTTKEADRRQLMTQVQKMANNQPAEYMAKWRESLVLAQHWNFWARAYAKGE